MRLAQPDADFFVPDGLSIGEAMRRTTHLAIGAHQDDLEFMAVHGILACFERDEQWFCGVTVTDGGGSPRAGKYADFSDDDMRRVRVEEQRKAAEIGKYGCQIQLAHPSSVVKNPQEKGPIVDLRAILESTRPSVVYLHNPADKHDTHIACFLRSLTALRALPADRRPAAVYGCEIWRDLDWMLDEDKVLLPLVDPSGLANALAAVFESQIVGGKRYDLAIAGRRRAHATFSESHSTDRHEQLSLAMDLTPLVADAEVDPVAFTTALMRRTEEDIRRRIVRFGG